MMIVSDFAPYLRTAQKYLSRFRHLLSDYFDIFFQGVVTGDPETERPLLTHVFNEYLHTPDQYLEMPNSLKYSTLSFYYQPKDVGKLAAKFPLYPLNFGWMTSEG